MELRMVHARATNDMDLTRFKRAGQMKKPMSELILEELLACARLNLNDHFIFQIGIPQSDIENAPYGGSRHNISAIIDERPFVQFHLDVGGDFLIDSIETVPGTDWLQFCGIPAPVISMISAGQQFAEKLHSYTLPRERLNTRTKDLIDLILILKAKTREPRAFLPTLQRVFKARNTHLLPAILPKPPTNWQKPFASMAAECGISQNMKEGFLEVADFFTRCTTHLDRK